jgi:tetratricopeptide (TPR) repeat protein
MGEVYRARDERLGRDVAIKVLPAEFAADPERLRRFEQEARAVAGLSHPNILALYDIGAHEGSPFIVSELLEGETLRDRLRAGGLTVRKAVEIGVQIAQGLSAAHEKGIVHRDLKPANVFITKDGHVKVLDFGIAKLVAPRTAEELVEATTVMEATAAGTILGTVGYMSPEQVRGQSVDHRTDIFSFGCVVFEMFSGRPPFQKDTAAESMTAILREEPPPLSTAGREVPPLLVGIVSRCLEKSPDDRFQSARDLAFDLRAIVTDSGGARAGPAVAPFARRRLAWLAACVVAALAGAVGGFFVLRGRAAKTEAALEPMRIVVAVFENQTGDRSLDPLGRMASDWIAQGLSQITSVEVVPTSETMQAEQAASHEAGSRSQADALRALAERTGAGTVVSGSYYLLGQQLQLQAKVTDAAHGTLVYAVEPVLGARESPMQVLEALRQRVMGVVATHFGSEMSLSPQVRRPPLFEAYREYVAGLEFFGEDLPGAIRHFEKAVEVDPDFFGPELYIAVAYADQGDYTRSDAITRRLNENREKLTPLERLLLDYHRARLAGRTAEALAALQQAWKLAPRSTLLAHLVGLYSLRLNLPQQTVDTYTRLAPERFFDNRTIVGSRSFISLMQAHHMLASYEGELEVAERAIQAFPDLLSVRGGKVRALAALGRLDELGGVIDNSLAVQSRAGTPSDLMLWAAAELRAHGNREEALRMAARAVSWLESRPASERAKETHRSELALALYAAERWDEARAIYEERAAQQPVPGGSRKSPHAKAAHEDVPETLRVSRAIDYLGALGALAARRSDRAEAKRISDELGRIEKPFTFGAHTHWRACIAALLGDKPQAMDLLRESVAQGKSYTVGLHRDMDLEPLWDYPPFQELLRPKG